MLSSPLGSGKDSKPGPCSWSSPVSREMPSLRTAGMCGLGVTAAERRARQDEPRGWEGQEPERLQGRPAETITRDRGPGDMPQARRSWGGGLQGWGTAGAGPAGVKGSGARVAAGR